MSIAICNLPPIPEVAASLQSVGFRWHTYRLDWYGEDKTKAQVDVLQALSYCAGRYYPEKAPSWAVEYGTGAMCPVSVEVCG
jgi:hypothetical protein